MPKKLIEPEVRVFYEHLDNLIEQWQASRRRRARRVFIPERMCEDLSLLGVTAIRGATLRPSTREKITISANATGQADPDGTPPRFARVMGSRQAKNRTAGVESRRPTLIFGDVNDELLFVEEAAARELAALWKAKTWGELKRKARRLYDEAMERLQEAADDADWEGDDESQPFAAPKDREAFEVTSIPGVEDGDWPNFIAQDMLTLLPAEVVEEFGAIAHTAMNGPMLHLDPADAKLIVQALEQGGYPCRRNVRLLCRALDMGD